ncbi:DUF6916 family protein [Roseibium alexandrii]
MTGSDTGPLGQAQEGLDLGAVSAADFQDHITTEFQIVSQHTTHPIELVSAEEKPEYHAGPGIQRTPFVLLFKVSGDFREIAGDGSEAIHKEGFGRLNRLHVTRVVPPTPASEGVFLEVCFT